MKIDSLEVLTTDCINLLEKNSLLFTLIAKEILEKEISTIEIDAEEKKKLKLIFMSQNKINNEEEFEAFLEKKNIKEEILMSKLSIPTKKAKYSSKNYSHMVEARFIKKKEDLDVITYSLLRVKDYNLAQELFYRIQDGDTDFGKLSYEFSEGPEKSSQGIVGPVSLSQTHQTLKEKLVSSSIGELNQPIKINNFWIITRLEAFEKAKLDDEMKAFLAEQIFVEYIQELSVKLHGNLIMKATATGNAK